LAAAKTCNFQVPRMARKGARRPEAKSNGSLPRWNNHDDIPDDEQDAFHRQQDKVVFGDGEVGNVDDDDEEYGESSCLYRKV
jgi:hypothetical protein